MRKISSLAVKVKVLRRERGMNQKQLAEAAQMTQATVSRIESGQLVELRLDTLKRLGKALRTTLDYLADRLTPDDLLKRDRNIGFLVKAYEGLSKENKQLLINFAHLLIGSEEKEGIRPFLYSQLTVLKKSRKTKQHKKGK